MMSDIVERLLEDVDQDIRDLMLAPAFPELTPVMTTDTGGGIQVSTASTASSSAFPLRRVQNWEMLGDPLFFIIQWQELRHENKS